jgi:RNA polymerase sigma-70 factor (ECF subfamily)
MLANPQALDQFLANVEQRAYRMAVIATGNRDDALDVVQDAMLKLAQKYPDRNQQEWGPLFQRIMQNTIRDWYRRQKVRNSWLAFLDATGIRKTAETSDQGAGMANLADCRAVDDNNPALTLVNDRTIDALDTALSRLPLRQQQAFLLRIWEGLSVAETATAMNCSQGSVKTHLSRAVSALREQLEDHRL